MTDLLSIVQGVATVIGGASVIAAAIPKGAKIAPVLSSVAKVINLLAFNFGSAKNKD